ncbi:MAG: hypothetical protein ACPLRY_08680 [Candidatus Bathyarchaeales archaeon]
MSRMPFPPELLLFVGIDFFVALSLLSSIMERLFPTTFPYMYQVAALAGFGQIWFNYAFLPSFVDARFWDCLFYLFAALLNIGAVNLYIAIRKRILSLAGMFLGAFTIPSFSISLFFVSAYVNGVPVPMPWLPIISIESLYIVLFVCIILVGLSIAVYIEPDLLKRKGGERGNDRKKSK